VPSAPTAAAASAPISTTAATVLSQRPPAPPPAAPAAVSRPATGEPAHGAGKRIVWIAAAAAALVLLVAVGWIVLRQRSKSATATPAQLAPLPSPEQQSHVTAAAAIAEARSELAQGEITAALQAVARAELAEPGNPDTAALRDEIESRQQEVDQAERAAKIEAALKTTRYAYGEHRYADAVAAGKSVLAIDPSNSEATKLIAASQAEIRDLKARQAEMARAEEAPPPPAPAAPAVEQPTVPKGPVIPADEALLRIQFASATSEGVLTIYAGEHQILRERFKFVRKTGFLLREKTSGTMEATRKLAPGTQTLLVYVALPGKPTHAISIDADLAGGTERVLDIVVDESGGAAAKLR